MAERTPPPWKVSSGSTHILPVSAAGGICKFESLHGMYTNHEANAAFIVKAVNSHDALVAFARYVLEMDTESEAPLFAKARAALSSIKEAV